jgi:hypothetical protein
VLAEWCLPLARKGGKVLCMKGPKANEELPEAKKAIKLGGGGAPIAHPVDLPGTEHRLIVEIPKIERSDKRLPRPASAAKGRLYEHGVSIMSQEKLVSVTLTEDEALVLFEAMERFDESANRHLFSEAEWVAIWRLTGQLESQNAVIFSPEYTKLIEAAKSRLTDSSK